MTSTNNWSNRDTNRRRRIGSRSQSRDNTNEMNTVDTPTDAPTRENKPPTMLHVDTNGTPTPMHLICIDQRQTVLSERSIWTLIEPLIETTRACKRVSAFSTVWPTNCIALSLRNITRKSIISRQTNRPVGRRHANEPTKPLTHWLINRRANEPSRSMINRDNRIVGSPSNAPSKRHRSIIEALWKRYKSVLEGSVLEGSVLEEAFSKETLSKR